MDKIEILEEYLTKVRYSRLSKNLQAIILYDIIQDQLSPKSFVKICYQKNTELRYFQQEKLMLL